MASYRIERDDADEILICRIEGFIDDDAAVALARDWRAAVIAAREIYPKLKILFDNSRGNVVSPRTAVLMSEATREFRQPTDRTAVLTTSTLTKLQAKRTMTSGGEIFVSEDEARAWLRG